MNILGISAFYHDSAAALVANGKLIAAAQEERFSRIKHDASFPEHAIDYCLSTCPKPTKIDAVVYYEKPLLKFSRILESIVAVSPKSLMYFNRALPIWLKKKLWITYIIESFLDKRAVFSDQAIHCLRHHEAHAASAFYPSPFKKAAILVMDGVGEWTTTSIGLGEDNNIELLEEICFPHSLGLLYSAFTLFSGFKINSGEYKLMGLAPYGQPIYASKILDNIIDLKEDGSFRLNMDYFGYLHSFHMLSRKFIKLFGTKPRNPNEPIRQIDKDLASSIQYVIELIILRIAKYIYTKLHVDSLCLAGGVALNCVANGKLLKESPFKNIWVQPAAGDAGGAVGAAMYYWHQLSNQKRFTYNSNSLRDMAYLGPRFQDSDITTVLSKYDNHYVQYDSKEKLAAKTAQLLQEQKVIGLFQGRMEFGPRALGNRSIIANPCIQDMQAFVNNKIKFRESFRPFAPVCPEEKASQYFQCDHVMPFMLFTTQVKKEILLPDNERREDEKELMPHRKIYSKLPAITHIDNSSRIQTLAQTDNPFLHLLLLEFEKYSGFAVLLNTSFNVKDEPIVCTPQDAYNCFLKTDLDYLILENYLISKKRNYE